jgi:benzoyl-CoA reductase/2-hydroxyglutaryl-CoA dehydratase subunit BcrC/BadD/HgdB
MRASGAIPVRLAGCSAEAEESGEKYLRADACSFCRSCLGGFESDPLQRQVDAVVAVSTCDMARRLPESIERYARVPAWTLYLPRTAEELPPRLAEFRRQLSMLSDWLGGLTGTTASAEALDSAIAGQNRLRRMLRELDARRASPGRANRPPTVRGSEVLNLTAMTWLLEPERAEELLRERPGSDRSDRSDESDRTRRPRLLLGGSMLAEDDRWLVEMLEEKADIVADTLCTGTRWFADDIDAGGDRLAALARFYFSRTPCACRRPNDRLYDFARRLIRERGVRGVVYKTLLYCDAWGFEARRLHAELGLPVLHIDSDYSGQNREQVRTRVEAFMETL